MMTRWSSLAIVALAMLCPMAMGQRPGAPADAAAANDSQAPAPRTEYMGRPIARTMHFSGAEWLTRPSREKEEACTKLLRALEIQPGQTVCDLGCGNGFYTLRMARRVGPKGAVWAVDIQPEMLELLADRAKSRNVDNLRLQVGTATSPQLPPASQDLVLLVDVYHEFSHPEAMLASVRECLKPTGRVALVEYRAEDPNVPIKPLHKMSQQQVMKEYEANGFQLVGQYDKLPWQHVFFFARDDSPLEPAALVPWPSDGSTTR